MTTTLLKKQEKNKRNTLIFGWPAGQKNNKLPDNGGKWPEKCGNGERVGKKEVSKRSLSMEFCCDIYARRRNQGGGV